MNPPLFETSSQLITLLASLMLVMQLLLAVQQMLVTNIRIFALQSLLLAATKQKQHYENNQYGFHVVPHL